MPQQAEYLEDRSLMSVSTLLVNGSELDIIADGDEDITIQADPNGQLQVLVGSTERGVPLAAFTNTPVVPVANLTSITIEGGSDDNEIDLRNVTALNGFNAALQILVNSGNGHDELTGSPDIANVLQGGDGNDTVTGGNQSDTLDGGDGADLLDGGVGNDSLQGGDGADSLLGNTGNDNIDGGDGNDTVSGGDGDDDVFAGNGTDSLLGDAGNDTLNGDGGTDSISGGIGNDSILGGESNDTLQGNDGNDTLDGQAGQDSIDGGANDTIAGVPNRDSLRGGTGNDTLNGNDGDDILNGEMGNDSLNGNAGNDRILGGGGNDVASGNEDDDTLFGNGGNDTLIGGVGADVLDGGAGNDFLRGNPPTISIDDVTVVEPDTGTMAAVFTVSLSEPTDTDVTVFYRTIDGTARSLDNDYQRAVSTGSTLASIVIPQGSTSAQITVLVNGDGFAENDETFSVELSLLPTANETLSDAVGVGTILDDLDTIIRAQINDASALEGQPSSPPSVMNFTVSLERASLVPVTLTYSTTPGTAIDLTANADFVGVTNGSIVIPVGATSANIPITINRDTLAGEGNESFTVTLGPVTNLLLIDSTAVGTILDDDDRDRGPGIFAIPDDSTNSIILLDTNTGLEVRRFQAPAAVRFDDGLAYDPTSYPGSLNGSLWYFSASTQPSPTLFRLDPINGMPLSVDPLLPATATTLLVNTGGPGPRDIAVLRDPLDPMNEIIYVLEGQNQLLPIDPGRTVAGGGGGQIAAPFLALINLPQPIQGNFTPGFGLSGAANNRLAYLTGVTRFGVGGEFTIFDVGNGAVTSDLNYQNALFGNAGVSIGVLPGPNPSDNERIIIGFERSSAIRAEYSIFDSVTGALIARPTTLGGYGLMVLAGDGYGVSLSGVSASSPFNLSTGTGDDSVNIGVDAYGSFGSQISASASDAVFDPAGALLANGTVTQSGIAVRVGTSGGRQFLSTGSIGGSAALPNRIITGTGSANSTFTDGQPGQTGALSFGLVQTADPLFSSSGAAIGSVLTQTYTVTNTGSSTANVELVRYVNGNLVAFDPTPGEGGGHLRSSAGEDLMFLTAAANANPDSTLTTFVAIDARIEGVPTAGSSTPANRFELNDFSSLATNIATGLGLTNSVNFDVNPVDKFVDQGQDFEAAAALRNTANIPAGGSIRYVTRTYFANSSPLDLLTPGQQQDFSDNTVLGGDGDDTLFGGSNDDVLNGGNGNDLLDAGDGQDSALGGSGRDTLDGSGGDDTLSGQGGDDTVIGGAGQDRFRWNAVSDGNDSVIGTAGADELQVLGSGLADAINVAAVNGELLISSGLNSAVTAPTINSVVIFGRGGNDTITVGDLTGTRQFLLTINGEAGNDVLSAAGMNAGGIRMLMDGGVGNDTLIGGKGRDTLQGGDGIDHLVGGDNHDRLLGQSGIDLLEGGAGNDTIYGDDLADAITGAGTGSNDTILGGDGNDLMLSGGGDDSADGGLGADTIEGNDGADTINGAADNDSLRGGLGTDNVSGGAGNDSLDGGRNDDTLNGNSGDDFLLGDHGHDALAGGAGNDTIQGGDGNDRIAGNDGNDAISGGDGNDTVNADGGDDTIIGGDGDDSLLGGDGNDLLLGRDGNDTVNGQSSTDILAGNQGDDVIVGDVSEINELFSLASLGASFLNSLGITL